MSKQQVDIMDIDIEKIPKDKRMVVDYSAIDINEFDYETLKNIYKSGGAYSSKPDKPEIGGFLYKDRQINIIPRVFKGSREKRASRIDPNVLNEIPLRNIPPIFLAMYHTHPNIPFNTYLRYSRVKVQLPIKMLKIYSVN
jgi:hypothetical protein